MGNPNWVKGVSGNPNGRPRRPEVALFRESLKKIEKEKGMTLLEHAIRKAFTDKEVLKTMLNKMLPDLSEGYMEQDTTITNKEAAKSLAEMINDIRTRIRKNRTVEPESGSEIGIVQQGVIDSGEVKAG